MNEQKIKIYSQIAADYFQKPAHHDGKLSKLHRGIMEVLNCSEQEAVDNALYFCNFMVTYGTTFASGYHEMRFTDYFAKLLENTFVTDKEYHFTDEHGYLYADSKLLGDLIGYEAKPETYINHFDSEGLNPDSFYKVKIKADTKGFHFMALVIPDIIKGVPNFALYDTSYRPLGSLASKYIRKDNFLWLLEV